MSTVLESPEDVLSTLARDGSRNWIYPVLSKGRFYKRRRIVAWALMALYILLPVVSIGGHPAVMLDFIRREFHLFGMEFYPTDTLLLMITMITILLFVIIVTALLGRVWCGWSCPQTVYLEYLFRPIERFFEGSEVKRKRRDSGPRTFDWIWRKSAKHAVFIGIALLLAHTFVAYFVGWQQLSTWMQSSPLENWGFFLGMAFTTGLVYFDFGFFREQMCTIACPYARMQSVLVDRDSLIVSYDPSRGEPRSRRSKAKMELEQSGELAQQGDCIDCGVCVRTCPTGIDIRDGLQMECIACTQCIDGCDSIMDKIGKPRGLISYTSENELENQAHKTWRPRMIAYAALLVFLLGAFTVTLSSRNFYNVNVGRVVGAPYTILPDGSIANRLRFRVRNQTSESASFTIVGVAPASVGVRMVGVSDVSLAPGEMKRVEAWITVEPEDFDDAHIPGQFELQFSDGVISAVEFELLGPNETENND